MPRPKVKDLYLGRFVRFTSGLSAENLVAYDTIPTPVLGAEQLVSPSNREAAGWIADLCKELEIKLMVVTLPMYEKHVADEDVWAGYIEDVVENEMGGTPWLNFQLDTVFTQNPNYFENTVKVNQHMTYNASVAASNEIAQLVLEEWGEELERRNDDSDWNNLFHNAEGFFAYNCPAEGAEIPSNIQVVGRNFSVGQLNVLDACIYSDDQSGEKAKFVQFRVNAPASGKRVQLTRTLKAQFRFRIGDEAEQRGVINIDKVSELSTDSVFVYRKLIVREAQLLQLESLSI
jgi:hypothetical protein